MSRIIVTGAAGFIGGHLVQELVKRGHEVLGMDDLSIHEGVTPTWIKSEQLGKVKWILGECGDCTNRWILKTELREFDPDIIFNLAVMPLPHSLEYPIHNFKTNVEIVQNILSLMDYCAQNVQLIHFSSSEVYGTAQDEIITEEHVLRPTTPYAAAKAACDHLIASYVNTYGIDAKIVRPFNCIGQRQNNKNYAAIIPLTVKRIKRGIPPIIYGDGSKTRDFTAVEDVVRGAIAVMEKGKTGEIYNICSSRETTVLEMMDMIANELGYKGCYQFSDERQGDVTRHLGCNRKAMIELGWSPEIGLREAVRRAIREY